MKPPPHTPRPPWRKPGTRWQLTRGREPERVFAVRRFVRSRQRVVCRIESDDALNGSERQFSAPEFYGPRPQLFEVGVQMELDA